MRLANFPSGLLALLGAQNFGKTLQEMGEQLVPVIDVGEQYLSNKQEILNSSSTVIGANFTAINGVGPVPAGEIWWIEFVSCLAVTAVGETIGAFSAAIRQNGAVIQISPGVQVAASQRRWSPGYVSGFWLISGAELGTFAAEVVGVPTGNVTAQITRLKA